MIFRNENFEKKFNVTITSKRVVKHVEIAYQWYQQMLKVLNRILKLNKLSKEVLKMLNRILGLSKLNKESAQSAQLNFEIEQIEQIKITSCI